MGRWAAALAVVAMLAGSASADVRRRKTATVLSVVGTAVSSSLLLASLFVGTDYGDVNKPLFLTGLGTAIVTPSLGELYGHEYVGIGMGVRAGAAAIGALATTMTDENKCERRPHCNAESNPGLALLGLAGIAYVGGAVYDIARAGDVVDRHDHPYYVSVSPMPSGGGLVFGGRF